MSKTKVIAVLRLESHDQGLELEALDRPMLVGRTQDCDMVIKDNSISRKHLEIRFAMGAWNIRDLESTKGTFINNIRVKGSKRLKAKDLLRLGELTFTVSFPAKKTLPSKSMPVVPAADAATSPLQDEQFATTDPGMEAQDAAPEVVEAEAAEEVAEANPEPPSKPAIPVRKTSVRQTKLIRKSSRLSPKAEEVDDKVEVVEDNVDVSDGTNAEEGGGEEESSSKSKKAVAAGKLSRKGKAAKPKSKTGLIIGAVAGVVVLGAAAFYYFNYMNVAKPADDKKAPTKDVAKKDDAAKPGDKPAADKPADAEKKDAPAAESKPAEAAKP